MVEEGICELAGVGGWVGREPIVRRPVEGQKGPLSRSQGSVDHGKDGKF